MHLVLLVIARDPAGVMHDDEVFFTTDLGAEGGGSRVAEAPPWTIADAGRRTDVGVVFAAATSAG